MSNAVSEGMTNRLKGTRWKSINGESYLSLNDDFRFGRDAGVPEAGTWGIKHYMLHLWSAADESNFEAFRILDDYTILETAVEIGGGGISYRRVNDGYA